MSGRARTRHDHNRFARRRRLNMREGESLASARKRQRGEDRCRDCGGLLFEADGGTGARCHAARDGGRDEFPAFDVRDACGGQRRRGTQRRKTAALRR